MFVRLMELNLIFLLVKSTASEWFSNGEHSFVDLNDQWEYLSKFAYTKNGNVEITLKFKRPDSDSEDQVVKVAFYQLPVESWDSTVLSTTTCEQRFDMAQQSIDLVVEDDRETEKERECFHYYDETVCKITKDINGNLEPWVFIAVVYCDNKISDLDLQWTMHATNGKSFLVKEVPVNDMGLYQAYLAFTIITAILIVFWVLYYKEIKLNMRVVIPYKIALFISLVGFALITGFYGRLHGTGYRNDSLFNSGFIFCMTAFVLIIQSSLSAVWSGSMMTVHLPRWKTILTIVIPIAFVIAMMTIFTLHYVDVKQRDVYPFEQRSDRYLVWVVLGFSLLIWLIYTVPIITNITSKADKISYLRILYFIISLYLLAVGGSPLIANFNMQTENRKMFVLVCFGAAHLFNFFFLFVCIKDNHTLKSIGHFWWAIFYQYMCCKFKLCPCFKCGKNNENKQGKSHALSNGGTSSSNGMYGENGGRRRRRGCCIGCCLSVCPCLICCPCCKGNDQGDRYSSETDLKKILVQNKNVGDFDLKIVDMDEESNKITPDTIIESEPIVISNNTPEKETPAPSRIEGKKPEVVVIDGFSDDGEQDQVHHDVNYKVLPWLYHDKPTKDLSPRRRFSNAIVKTVMNVKDHGYKGGAPNHWTDGNHKPFATAENKPIVLYKRPDSDHLFSASQSSLDGGVRKPATFVPLKSQMSVPVQSGQRSVPILARSLSSNPPNISPRLIHTGSTVRRSTEYPHDDDIDDEPDTFNIAEYNSSRIRDNKVKTNTMMYRRETLKHNLSNVPTPLLLKRVPDGTIKTDSGLDQVVSKTKIVKSMQKPKVEPKVERSKSDLWKLLAKKYKGKPLDETASNSRSVQSRKTPRALDTPNTLGTGNRRKTPR